MTQQSLAELRIPQAPTEARWLSRIDPGKGSSEGGVTPSGLLEPLPVLSVVPTSLNLREKQQHEDSAGGEDTEAPSRGKHP